MDKPVVLKGGNHKQGEVHPARDVAREDGIADMPAPYGQALARPFFKIAAADDSPPSVARKDPSACFHLVVDLHGTEHPPNPFGSL